MNFLKIPNKKGDKFVFYQDFGRSKGQRVSTGIFIHRRPKNQTERNHNKEMLTVTQQPTSKASGKVLFTHRYRRH